MKRHHHTSSLALNDMLFNILLGFVLLFIIAFLLINPITKKSDIPTKAEIMIVVEWHKDASDDVDVWMRRDNGPQVGFNNKDATPIHLDRDDLGTKNDIVVVNGKTEIIKHNREIMTLRGIVPGDYYITIHAYSLANNRSLEKPLVVTVTVFDVNPYEVIYVREVKLAERGDKINVPGFTLNSEGQIIDTFEHNKNLGPNLSSGYYPDAAVRNSR